MKERPLARTAPADLVWGGRVLRGRRKLIRLLVTAGLAHGPVKRWLLRWWAACGAQDPVDLVYQGLKWRLYPHDNAVEVKMVFGSRLRDGEEMRMLQAHLPQGGTFLDVGANIGYYSLMATVFGAARVIAVEPHPTALERLRFNVASNNLQERITVLPVALGSARQSMALDLVAGDLGGSRVSEVAASDRQIQVPVVPMAEMLAEQAVDRIDAMKIDVEGYEDAVLCPFYASAPRSLWPRLVIIEYPNSDEWQTDVVALLRARGYVELRRNRSNLMLHLAA